MSAALEKNKLTRHVSVPNRCFLLAVNSQRLKVYFARICDTKTLWMLTGLKGYDVYVYVLPLPYLGSLDVLYHIFLSLSPLSMPEEFDAWSVALLQETWWHRSCIDLSLARTCPLPNSIATNKRTRLHALHSYSITSRLPLAIFCITSSYVRGKFLSDSKTMTCGVCGLLRRWEREH